MPANRHRRRSSSTRHWHTSRRASDPSRRSPPAPSRAGFRPAGRARRCPARRLRPRGGRPPTCQAVADARIRATAGRCVRGLRRRTGRSSCRARSECGQGLIPYGQGRGWGNVRYRGRALSAGPRDDRRGSRRHLRRSDGVVPNLAFPRPLPRPRGRRQAVPVDAISAIDVAAPDIIEAAGIRWIHIESPRTADRDWLEEHFDFHPLDYEDVYSRNNRPKLDQYDDYVFIVLHFPMFEKETSRILTAEIDLFMGPDYLITLPSIPLPPLTAMFERYREKADLRDVTFSKGTGYLLYKIVDTCVDASFPMLRKMEMKLDRIEDDIFEGRSSEIVRDISEAKQEIINFRRIVRPQRAVLRDLERTKQRYLQEELEIYFDDISDAAERIWDTLENYKEVIEGLESSNESVLSHQLNDSFRILTAASVVLLPLTLIASIFGMNVQFPGENQAITFYLILVVMAVLLVALVILFRRRGWL